ncbi:MAG: D-tyrosyl-tRNA(Tyr) deacylase [Clostridia bacterium]|nr:D-tyrosyl-tRNA(Tyr) deacylase [Clostridia bacterium]
MRVVFQRVTSASVTVDNNVVGSIRQGAILLLGIHESDTKAQADLLAKKCAEMRVFSDPDNRLNLSVKDIQGGILVIPNFTLYGNCRHGRRPEFLEAAKPDIANPLFKYFVDAIRSQGVTHVSKGIFGADMHLDIQGDGPITIILDSDQLSPKK